MKLPDPDDIAALERVLSHGGLLVLGAWCLATLLL